MTKSHTKRGFTLIEFMAAMFIMLLCLSVISPMIRTTSKLWTSTTGDRQNKELLSRAVQKLSPTLRNTLRVDTSATTAHYLVVILPKQDPITGAYIYPLQDGKAYAYYLSDTSGDPNKKGTILWRSVSGTPDKNWSLRSGKGGIDFGTSNLSFSFDDATNPSTVTMTAFSTQWQSNKPLSATVSATVLLRNHEIAGL